MHQGGATYSDCPDSLATMQFWKPNSNRGSIGKGECVSFDKQLSMIPYVRVYKGGFKSDHMFDQHELLLPGSNGTLEGPHLIYKATTAKPHMTSKEVGVIMLKRTVMHPHTNRTDSSGRPLLVGGTFKIGYCIKCPSKVFSQKGAPNNDDTDHKKFYDDCLVNAFNASTSNLKSSFECDPTSEDYGLAKALIAAY